MIKMEVQVNGKLPESAFREIEDSLQAKVMKLTKAMDDNNSVTVGLHPDAQDYAKIEHGTELKSNQITSVVMIGAIHEFGVGVQPKRPWLSSSFEKDINSLRKMFMSAISSWTDDPKTLKGKLDSLGRYAVSSVKSHVFTNDIGLVANKEATAKRKGGNTPMIDTRHLVKQIDYKVGKDLLR